MSASGGSYNRFQQLTSCRLVSTSNVSGVYANGPSNNGVGATLTSSSTGSLTIDSVVVEQGDRVLLQAQTSAWQNGIYDVLAVGSSVSQWQLQRSDDMQISANIRAGMFCPIEAGTLDAGVIFCVVEPVPNVLGVDALVIESSPTNSGLGTAATKEASDNSKSVVASVINPGTLVIGDLLFAGDINGSVEDSGVSKDDLMLMPAASVIGNFPKASNTLGTMVDSGISPSDATKTKAVMAGSAVQVGYLAHFIDTTGTVDDTAGAAINNGNIQAGQSASAGKFISYPGTAANGTFMFEALNAGGAFDTTVRNSVMGQTAIVSIPDPGASTANFLLNKSGGTQTIASGSLALTSGNITITSGNFAASSGTMTASGNITSSAGNHIAGASGAAGTLVSFPATAANGSLIVAAANAGGAFNTTISNGTMGQSTVMTIPDVGAATGQFLAKTAALIDGNFVQASGTAGKVVDSGLSSANVLQVASVAITAAQFNGMYATPKLLVAAQGANTLIIVDHIVLLMTYVSANYAAGGVAAGQWDSTANGAGVIATTTLSAATFQAAASTGFMFNTGVVPATFSTCVNKGIYLSNITGAFTTGDSTFVAKVYYRVIATV